MNLNLVTYICEGEIGSIVFTNPLGNGLTKYDAPQLCQVSKFPKPYLASHFPLGIQTFLVLFMVETISFGTQTCLTPYVLA